MQNSDNILIQKLAEKGDTNAFTEIIDRYAGLVYSVCYRILGDPERAKDAAQDTFFSLLQSPKNITYSLSGWLHKVATRAAIDIVRKDSSRQKREVDYISMTPIKASRWKDISHYIDEALASLDEESRELLIQHFLQGKKQEVLAVELGMSQATVSRKIKTGLEKLREQLKKKGVIISGTLLGTLLISSISEAAPLGLLNELGKMALFRKVSDLPGVAKEHTYLKERTKLLFDFRSMYLISITIIIGTILILSYFKHKKTNSPVTLAANLNTEITDNGKALGKKETGEDKTKSQQYKRITGANSLEGSCYDTEGLTMGDVPISVTHVVNVMKSRDSRDDEVLSSDIIKEKSLPVVKEITLKAEVRTKTFVGITLNPIDDSCVIDTFLDTLYRIWRPRINEKTLEREGDIYWYRIRRGHTVKYVK